MMPAAGEVGGVLVESAHLLPLPAVSKGTDHPPTLRLSPALPSRYHSSTHTRPCPVPSAHLVRADLASIALKQLK